MEKKKNYAFAPSKQEELIVEEVPVIEEVIRTATAVGRVNVRKEPSLESEIIRVVEDGVTEEIKGEVREWYKFVDGYSMKQFYK